MAPFFRHGFRPYTSLPGGESAPQPELFSEFELERYSQAEADEHNPIFTGERFRMREPEKYALVVKLLGEGTLGKEHIAQLVGCSINTVLAIERHPDNAELVEGILAKSATRVRRLSGFVLDRAEEMLADPKALKNISFKELMIAVKTLVELGQLLDGRATKIVALEGPAPAYSLQDHLRQARDITAEVTEAGPGMDSERKNPSAMGAGAPAPVPALPARTDPVEVEAQPVEPQALEHPIHSTDQSTSHIERANPESPNVQPTEDQ